MNDASLLHDLLVRRLSPYAIFLINPDGRFASWNAGVQQILGYSEDEFIGLHCSLIFTEEDRNGGIPEMEMRKAAETGNSSNIRWHVRKDGSRFYGNGTMSCARNDKGEIVAFAKIMSDETSRKQLEDRLLESNESLDRFTHIVSHDLQEPLRTICSYVDLIGLRGGDRLDRDFREPFEFIQSASKRLRELVRELLSYAQMNARSKPLEPANLDDLVEAAIANLQQAIKETGAAVTHGPLPVVCCDQIQIMQLFQNLIGNSLKYRKTGEPPHIHIQANRQGHEWVVSVHDNGIGFDTNSSSRIFDPFRRLHSDESKYPGMGMGLAIAKRIVDRHEGRIWAEARQNEGATFYFTLPANSDQ